MNDVISLLLLEDNPDHQALFRDFLSLTSYANARLAIASSLQQGRSLLASTAFDLIFLDLSLQDSDIQETLAAIASLNAIAPVIVLTSLDDRETILDVIHQGAEDCLPKSEISDLSLERTIRFNLDRWQLRRRVEQSEQKFRSLIANVHAGVIVHDASTAIISCNPMAQQTLGLSESQLLGKTATDPDWYFLDQSGQRMPPEQYPVNQVMRHGEPLRNLTLGIRHPERHQPHWVLVDAEPLFDATGKIETIIVSFSDISQLRQAEQALRESEARYHSLLENGADAFFLIDMRARIRDVNLLACESLGYSRDELLSMPITDIEYELTPERAVSTLVRLNPGEIETKNGRHRRKDGSDFPVEVRITLIVQQGERMALAHARNISERRQAAEKIRLFSRAMRQSSEAVIITDVSGKIEHINPAFTTITGFSEEEALGKNPRILKSGNQNKAFYEKLWQTLLSGQPWQGKVINKKKNGDFYPAMLTISPLLGSDGQITHFVGQQQSLEQFAALEAQLQQAQKMEAIGTLVGGIAHDFNNTLAGITGNTYLARLATTALPEVTNRLDSIERLSFGAAAIIQQLLAFSRKGVVQMHPFALAPFIRETIKLHQISLPENILLQLVVNDSDMQINGDVNQLQQVLMNLINNAFDAVQNVAEPTIRVSLTRFAADDSFITRHQLAEGGEYACISVEDNGEGIERRNLKHIFEPFFTTKETGKGSGLGLAMAYGAIHSHGGSIDIKSSVIEPTGTTLHIYLPLLQAAPAVVKPKKRQEPVRGKSETILLVDDNQMLLETGKEILQYLGYAVFTAVDGEQAVELYRQHVDDIDLMILDVVMPKMGGLEAMQEIRQFKPDARAIFATGYDRISNISAKKQLADEIVISKPFDLDLLSLTIRQALEDRVE